MAADRYPRWAAEQAGTAYGPSVADVLVLFAVVTLVLLGLLSGPEATADGGRWPSPACAEQARLERHGATSGPSYARVVRACRASTAP
jgi:hypothetical protein